MNIEILEAFGITREDILNKAADKLLSQYEEQGMAKAVHAIIKEELIRKATPLIEQTVQAAAAQVIDTPYSPVDEWGQPTGKPTTIKEQIKNVAVNYLAVKVNRDGKTDGYDKPWTRGDYIAHKAAKDVFSDICGPEFRRLIQKAKAELQQKVAEFITEQILKK